MTDTEAGTPLTDVLDKVRALRMRYEPGSVSPAYENGWYDGRGAAAQVVADATRSARTATDPAGMDALREAAQEYIDWRDRRAAQWDAVARHDHEHGMTPCPEWDALTSEPFDIDQRLDDAIRAALARLSDESK